jgi:DNA-damage-inducible protein J
MHKSAFIRARVEPDLKASAEGILEELGISPTQAVTMLYKRIIRDRERPLELKVPNATTRKAMEDTEASIGLIHCSSVDDMFKKLSDDT